MNDREFSNNKYDIGNDIRMQRMHEFEKQKGRGRVFAGVLLFFAGILLLLKTANFVWLPGWLFTWPMILIAIGLFTGVKHKFRGGTWFILILAGSMFIINKINPVLNLDRFIWPVILILVGIGFILRPKKRKRLCGWQKHKNNMTWAQPSTENNTQETSANTEFDRTDIIDVTTVFGGIKKKVLSKKFEGGDITSLMGGSEIDLSQADFTGKITIDINNIFGGTKLIIPSTWEVHNDIVAIFGGVDDKRQCNVSTNSDKILILEGSCVFGGVEIRSF